MNLNNVSKKRRNTDILIMAHSGPKEIPGHTKLSGITQMEADEKIFEDFRHIASSKKFVLSFAFR